MSDVAVRSYLRLSDGGFVRFEEVDSHAGDCRYVPGAIVLSIGGIEVMSLDLWDDINWLWPYVVHAFDECRQAGSGERFFPDQPLRFRVDALGSSDQLLVSVSGGSIDNKAVGPAKDIYEAIALAAQAFYASLRRVCPSEDQADDEILTIVDSWNRPSG